MYLIPDGSSMTHLPDWFGIIRTPHAYGVSAGIREGRWFAVDNAAFTKGFNPEIFFPFLDSLLPYKGRCLFVTVPDVVADAAETMRLWHQWSEKIAEYGFPLAWVAQDGCKPEDIPRECAAVFIGGSTEFKLGSTARKVAKRARELGKWLHVGRVNTWTRIKYAKLLNADSVDGTCIAFGRDINLARLNRWMPAANAQMGMWK